MKKTYINPEMEVVEVKACQPLLTESLGFGEPTSNVDVHELEDFDNVLNQMGM